MDPEFDWNALLSQPPADAKTEPAPQPAMPHAASQDNESIDWNAELKASPPTQDQAQPQATSGPTSQPTIEQDGSRVAPGIGPAGAAGLFGGDPFVGATALKIGEGAAMVGAGVVQASLDGLAKMGIIDKQTADNFTNLTNEEKAKVDELFKKKYGDNFGFHIAEGTGEVLPAFLIPAAGKTALQRIAYGTAAGAGMAAAQYQADESSDDRGTKRLQNAEVGGILGAGASTAIEALIGLRNFIPNAIEKAKKLYAPIIAEGIDLQNRTGIFFKLSQLARDPWVETLERFARGGSEGERIGRAIEDAQPKQVLDYFDKLVGSALTPAGMNKFGNRIENAYTAVLGDAQKGTGLLGERVKNAASNFEAAQQAGGKIYVGNFLKTIDSLIGQNTLPGAGKAERALAGELQSVRDNLLDTTARRESFLTMRPTYISGELSPRQLQARLQAWGAAAKGTGRIFSDAIDTAAERGPAKALFSALNKDLDAAIDAGGAGAAELKTARDAYAGDTAKILALRDSALGKLFGVKAAPSTEEIESRFLTMDPSEITATMKILSKEDSLVREHLQKFWLSRAMEKARVPGEAGATGFLPAKLLDLVSGAKGPSQAASNRETFNAVFTDPTLKRQVQDGLKAVSTMMANNFRTSGRTVARLKNLANVAMQSSQQAAGLVGLAKQAVTRWAADVLAPEAVARYVLDPKGVKSLIKLAEPANDAATSAVLGDLFAIYNRGEPAQADGSAQ